MDKYIFNILLEFGSVVRFLPWEGAGSLKKKYRGNGDKKNRVKWGSELNFQSVRIPRRRKPGSSCILSSLRQNTLGTLSTYIPWQ